MEMVPMFVRCFSAHSKSNPIKAPEIIKRLKEKGSKISEPRLRKIVNYIRTMGMIPLIATSKGYYVSFEMPDIQDQISSLKERANSINRCADGLSKFIHPFNN
jgi:hypothetical protein